MKKIKFSDTLYCLEWNKILNHKYISDKICEKNIKTIGDNFVKESNKRTEELIGRCEDTEELKKIIHTMISSRGKQWSCKIKELIEKSEYTISKFARLCRVGRGTVYKWCAGSAPHKRETFLRIAMATGLNGKETDHLLKYYGGYAGLYAKRIEDCVCIYVLERYQGEEAVFRYDVLLDKMKDKVSEGNFEEENDITTNIFEARLMSVADEEELDQFVEMNAPVFTLAYASYRKYLMAIIGEVCTDNDQTINGMAERQGWSASLRRSVYAISQNTWYPTRNKIISLGLHLNRKREEIDEMLEKAHMGMLSTGSIFDCALIYILISAGLNNLLDKENPDYDQNSLCRYARTVIHELDLLELEPLLREIEEIED